MRSIHRYIDTSYFLPSRYLFSVILSIFLIVTYGSSAQASENIELNKKINQFLSTTKYKMISEVAWNNEQLKISIIPEELYENNSDTFEKLFQYMSSIIGIDVVYSENHSDLLVGVVKKPVDVMVANFGEFVRNNSKFESIDVVKKVFTAQHRLNKRQKVTFSLSLNGVLTQYVSMIDADHGSENLNYLVLENILLGLLPHNGDWITSVTTAPKDGNYLNEADLNILKIVYSKKCTENDISIDDCLNN
ncbi:MAG: hypothetical protein RJQ21_08005 [Rhodospirillales bacterium]